MAVIVAVGVNADGRREVLGTDIGPSEAEPFGTEFLRKLGHRGLRGVKLVVSDAHEGPKAAISKVLSATWRRCRVHFMRNALAHAGKSGRRVISAFVATAFARDDVGAASQKCGVASPTSSGRRCRNWPNSWTRRRRTCSPKRPFHRSAARSFSPRTRSSG